MSDAPKLAPAGGSYVVDAKGKLARREHTIQLDDPEHPDNQARRTVAGKQIPDGSGPGQPQVKES